MGKRGWAEKQTQHPPVEIPVLVFCDLNPFPLLKVVNKHRFFNVCHPLYFTGHGASYQGGAHRVAFMEAKAGGKNGQTGLNITNATQTRYMQLPGTYLQVNVRKEPVIGIS